MAASAVARAFSNEAYLKREVAKREAADPDQVIDRLARRNNLGIKAATAGARVIGGLFGGAALVSPLSGAVKRIDSAAPWSREEARIRLEEAYRTGDEATKQEAVKDVQGYGYDVPRMASSIEEKLRDDFAAGLVPERVLTAKSVRKVIAAQGRIAMSASPTRKADESDAAHRRRVGMHTAAVDEARAFLMRLNADGRTPDALADAWLESARERGLGVGDATLFKINTIRSAPWLYRESAVTMGR